MKYAIVCGLCLWFAWAPLFAEERSRETQPPSTGAVSFGPSSRQLDKLTARGVELGDFNGDAKLDAFVVNQNSPEGSGHRVYFGDGNGGFKDSGQRLPNQNDWGSKPAVGDVNGDRKPDVVTGKTIWINDGTGTFTARSDLIRTAEKGELRLGALADLNQDGSLDYFAILDWKYLRVFLNDGRGTLRDSGQRLEVRKNAESSMVGAVALGDVDGDGTVDAVIAGWRNAPGNPCPNRVWLNDGQANFRDSGQALDEGQHHAHDVALGDLNGDGKLDAVLGLTTPGHAGKVYLNEGEGHLKDTGQILGHQWTHSVNLGDFNGDGSPDIFLACGEPQSGTPNEVWLNNGQAEFRDSGLRLGHAFSWDAATGDLDGDARPDVFVANLRLTDAAKTPPVFGGALPEIWLNTTAKYANAERNDLSWVNPRVIESARRQARVMNDLEGDYLGQTPPGPTPQVFARGIVSTDDKQHGVPSFSPDGKEVFWWDNRQPGPNNSSWLSWGMTMHREKNRWSVPEVSRYNGIPVFSPDGKRMYFGASRPDQRSAKDTRDDIWHVEKQGNGWSEPKCLNLISQAPELQFATWPTMARNGNLYFISSVPEQGNKAGIARAEFINGRYAKPELLPPNINMAPYRNWAPFIAPDESYLIFSSTRPGSLDDGGDLYISRPHADGSWSDPVRLGGSVNSNTQERFSGLSPDGKYFFFTRWSPEHDEDVYWMDAAAVPELASSAEHQAKETR